MEPEELRIGNWINTNRGVVQVEELSDLGVIDPDTTNHDGISYFKIEPIPLTTDHMYEFGFHQDKEFEHIFTDFWLFNGGMYFELQRNENGEWSVLLFSKSLKQRVLVRMIKYVHQLQNIYYEITGKPLIK